MGISKFLPFSRKNIYIYIYIYIWLLLQLYIYIYGGYYYSYIYIYIIKTNHCAIASKPTINHGGQQVPNGLVRGDPC